ncbi:MAG: GNAT family N-acetyltransferase [Candidatus Hodarchaeota archaeon]
MEVKFFEDINEFYDLAYSFLLEREVENGLQFSILNSLKKNINRYGQENPSLCAIYEDKNLKLISLRTPPYNQVLSYTSELKAIEFLVEALLKRKIELPGVLGFKEGVEKFIMLWCNKRRVKSQIIRNERIYKLEHVAEETLGKNKIIKATAIHENIVLQWGKEFILEAFPDRNPDMVKHSLSRLRDDIYEGKIFLLLDNNKPVSMARKGGKSPNGVVINNVYTPPSLRRRGYATGCVVALSKHLLKKGYKFCFLFTDLSNPTSNSIYQKIGFRPIIDVDEFQFIKG